MTVTLYLMINLWEKCVPCRSAWFWLDVPCPADLFKNFDAKWVGGAEQRYVTLTESRYDVMSFRNITFIAQIIFFYQKLSEFGTSQHLKYNSFIVILYFKKKCPTRS